MRLLETIKIVDGKCHNIDYHSRRAGFEIETPIVSDEFSQGVVKWRIVYEDGQVVQSEMSHYTLPRITSLRIVDGTGVNYSRKYENRDGINDLWQQREGCDDILILRDGMVSDTSFCNVVFESEYGLFTPSTPLLAGTKRQMLLDKGIIVQRNITVNDIKDFKCVHLINAMIELEDDIMIFAKFKFY